MTTTFQTFSDEAIVAQVDIPLSEASSDTTHTASLMRVNSAHKAKVGQLLAQAENERQRATALLRNGTITGRDIQLLETFVGVGILTSSQIHALFWSKAKISTPRKRLGKLIQLGLLESSSGYQRMLVEIGFSAENVYQLAPFGKMLLAVNSGKRSSRQLPYDSHYYHVAVNNRLMKHHVMTAQIYTTFKVGTQRHRNRLLWVNEMSAIVRDAEGKELVRPDGQFKIYREGLAGQVQGFVETDTRHTAWEKKIRSYEKAFALGDWQAQLGSKFPTVFCVVPNDKAVMRVGELVRLTRQHVNFMLKSWPQFKTGDPFEQWYIPHLSKFTERWLPQPLDSEESND